MTLITPEPLLPCPFCGNPGRIRLDESADYTRYWRLIICCSDNNCPAYPEVYGPEGVWDEEAIKLVTKNWNTRI